jgi:hypothetical protein
MENTLAKDKESSGSLEEKALCVQIKRWESQMLDNPITQIDLCFAHAN